MGKSIGNSWQDRGRSSGVMAFLLAGCAAIGTSLWTLRVEAAGVLWEVDSDEWQGLAARSHA